MKEEIYHSPMNDEIAILMLNDNVSNRDILLHCRDDGLQHISELLKALQYPLLFSHGADGWHVNLQLQDEKELIAVVAMLATTSYYMDGKANCSCLA